MLLRCRRVSPEDLAACEERYNKSKLVHSIMRHVAETEQADLIELYSTVAWPLYKLMGHAFDALKLMVIQADEMWAKLAEENAKEGRTMDVVTANVKKAIMSNVSRRLTPQPLKIRADIEMTCFHYDGVEHIKVCPPRPPPVRANNRACTRRSWLHCGAMGVTMIMVAIMHDRRLDDSPMHHLPCRVFPGRCSLGKSVPLQEGGGG